MMKRLWTLLPVIGLAGLTGCATLGPDSAPVTDQQEFTQQVTVPPNAKILEIIHYNGNVKIEPGSSPNVLLEGVKRATAGDVIEARAILDSIRMTAYERAPDRLVLEHEGPRNLLGFGPSRTGMDLVVHAPAGMAIDLFVRNGDALVYNFDNNVTVDHAGGDARVENIAGRASVKSSGRTVAVRNIERSADLETADANVTVENIRGGATIRHDNGEMIVSNVQTNLVLNCRRSNIRIENIPAPIELENDVGEVVCNNFFDSIRAYVNRGTLNLQPGVPIERTYDCSVENGDLILRAPESSNILVDITAERGRIHSDYSMPIWADRGVSYARGAVNGGQFGVKLTVRNGAVSLFKTTANASPAGAGMGAAAGAPQTNVIRVEPSGGQRPVVPVSPSEGSIQGTPID